MEKETQISALVSRTTKELLDGHVRATGVKKGHLVEQALRHHLQALQELPADVVAHPKIVVTRRSGEAILRQMESGTSPARRHVRRGPGSKRPRVCHGCRGARRNRPSAAGHSPKTPALSSPGAPT